MTAERHHYVPQFYLRGFVKDPKHPRLFAIDTTERKVFHPSPKDVAVELNFHTIDISGKPSDVVETTMSEMESMFAPAVARIRESQSLASDEDRGLLFTFMAFLLIKNPRMRSRISKPLGDLALYTMQMEASDPESWNRKMEQAKREGTIAQGADTEQLRRLLLQGDAFKVGLSVAAHLYFEFRAIDFIAKMLEQRHWMLLRAPQNKTGFITSDNPVTLTWYDQEGTPYPPGLGLPNTQLLFPIANELGLMGTFEYRSQTLAGDDAAIAGFNGNTIIYRNRQVYARDSEFLYQMKHNTTLMRGLELLEDPAVFTKERE
jgi:hypothetical protein